MSEPTVEGNPEYNSDSERQRVEVEFREEADESSRMVADELREISADDYPPDQGEGPDAVPPGYREPEGGA